MSRFIKPLAAAFVALLLIVLAVLWPPETVQEARGMPDPYSQQLLPRSDDTYRRTPIYATQESTVDDVLFVVYVAGLSMVFMGSVALIWSRSRQRGRHRVITRHVPQPVGRAGNPTA